jgi:hypothetical protein
MTDLNLNNGLWSFLAYKQQGDTATFMEKNTFSQEVLPFSNLCGNMKPITEGLRLRN